MRTLVLFIFALCLSLSCSNDSGKKENAPVNSGKKIELKAFPADQLSTLKKECTSIDLISLKKEINVSMSFDNPQAVSIILSFITDEEGHLTNMCVPDAHLVFQKNGDILQDLDLYYKGSCNALVFLDQTGKQIAANKISKEGIDFFNNFLKNKSTQDTTGKRQ